MAQYSRLFTIIHPIIVAGETKPEKALALFDYFVVEEENHLPQPRFHVIEHESIQILPSQEEMENEGLSFVNHLRTDADSLYLRREEPLYIRDESDLVVMRKSLVERITDLLQHSISYQK